MPILQLGEIPAYIWPYVDYLKFQEPWHVSIDWIESEDIKVLVIEVKQGHYLDITEIHISDDHAPIQRHLYVIWTYLDIYTGAVEAFEEDQWHEIIINVVLIAVIQYTIANVIYYVWQFI